MVHDWCDVASILLAEPPGTTFRVPRHLAQHPLDGGLRQSIGLPQGQKADFRLDLKEDGCLHVRDFGSYYEAHLDAADPKRAPLLHLLKDAPRAYITGAAVLGSLVGLLLGRSKKAMVAGLLCGAALGGLSSKAARDGALASEEQAPRRFARSRRRGAVTG